MTPRYEAEPFNLLGKLAEVCQEIGGSGVAGPARAGETPALISLHAYIQMSHSFLVLVAILDL